MKRIWLAAALALLAVRADAQEKAQENWPLRPVRVVVAFAPAGIGDIIARIVGQALQEAWRQPVVIENRGGGGGNIAAGAVARAEPDGYTVLATTSAFTVNLSLYAKPGYALSDFKVGAVAANSPNIIIADPNLKQATLPAIIAAARTEPYSFGSAGIGTTPHLTGERIFRVISHVDVRHVPFTGAGPATNAAMAGQVPVAVVALPAAIEQVKAGTVKGVAVSTGKRLPDLPDVPTVAETGVGDVEDGTNVLFLFPAKTPDAIVAKFNADLNAILRSGALDKPFAAAGSTPVVLDARQASAAVGQEIDKWASVVRAANLKVE